MTENEAIVLLRLATDEAGDEEISDVYKEMCKLAIQALEEIQQYRAIGTVEELQALKEKNTEKKAVGSKLYNEACCPNCGYTIADDEFWALSEYTHYCEECGQAVKYVDWQ